MKTTKRHFLRFLAVFLTFAALLSLSAFTLTASADEEPALATLISNYIQSRKINGSNISVAYYNTVSGEEYVWNGYKYFTAASIYKLPLNMYYYEMEAAGEISPNARFGGYTLAYSHKLSLQYSNNEVSEAMLRKLGTYRQYKTLMSKYGGIPAESLPEEYFTGNKYCTAFILNTLKILYDGRDGVYAEAVGYLKAAHPGEWFERKLPNSECVVAQKYGALYSGGHGYFHTAGIIYADEPFLLVVFTQDVTSAERVVIGDIARICYDYTKANIGAWRQPVSGFEDVYTRDWYAGAVSYCAGRGLMKGTSDTTFSPNDTLTRAMFVTLLGRFAGVEADSSKDVAYYSPYVEWAYENGIINVVDDTDFAPGESITREQVAVMLHRYLMMEEPDATAGDLSASPFRDTDAISDYAKESVDALYALGIFIGDTDGCFNPQGSFTRAEAAALFMRLDQKAVGAGDSDAAETDTPEEETVDTPEEETPDTPEEEVTDAPEGETADIPERETVDAPEGETTDTPAESEEEQGMAAVSP